MNHNLLKDKVMDKRNQLDLFDSYFAEFLSHLLNCEGLGVLLQEVVSHELIHSTTRSLFDSIQLNHQVNVVPDLPEI